MPAAQRRLRRIAGRAVQMLNADRAESWLNLGSLDARLGDGAAAEAAYKRAIEADPHFAPDYVNLADVYRALGRDAEGEAVLRQGLKSTDDPALDYSLGLLLIRQQRREDAISALRTAPSGRRPCRACVCHALALDAPVAAAGDRRAQHHAAAPPATATSRRLVSLTQRGDTAAAHAGARNCGAAARPAVEPARTDLNLTNEDASFMPQTRSTLASSPDSAVRGGGQNRVRPGTSHRARMLLADAARGRGHMRRFLIGLGGLVMAGIGPITADALTFCQLQGGASDALRVSNLSSGAPPSGLILGGVRWGGWRCRPRERAYVRVSGGLKVVTSTACERSARSLAETARPVRRRARHAPASGNERTPERTSATSTRAPPRADS